MKRWISAAILLPLAVQHGACCPANPASSIVRVEDTAGRLEPAAIHFSEPTVFGRESLIADRIRENQFFEAKLASSTTDTFGSQLTRDLQTISTLAATF